MVNQRLRRAVFIWNSPTGNIFPEGVKPMLLLRANHNRLSRLFKAKNGIQLNYKQIDLL